MRMPYAATRQQAALNKAYAFVLSREFGKSAQTLIERLKDKGFDETEAAELIPSTIPYDQKTHTLTFTSETTDEHVEQVAGKLSQEEAFDFKRQYAVYKSREEEPSPAKRGERFVVPKLLVELQGKFRGAPQ